METRATARYVRISPRKARLVVDLIRGRDLAEARRILDFQTKAAARVVAKVLASAAANAENNNNLSPDTLYVARAYVDEGPTLKRFRPRALGRATRINKRTSHITVVLDERKPAKAAGRRRLRRKQAERPDAEIKRAGAAGDKEKEALEKKRPAAGKAAGTAGKARGKKKAAEAEDRGLKKPTVEKPAKAGKKPAARSGGKKKLEAGKKAAEKKPESSGKHSEASTGAGKSEPAKGSRNSEPPAERGE